MMHLRSTRAVKLACPKHPRFNPSLGVGAVKQGCRVCHAACDAYEAYHVAVRAIEKAQQLAFLERSRSTGPRAPFEALDNKPRGR